MRSEHRRRACHAGVRGGELEGGLSAAMESVLQSDLQRARGCPSCCVRRIGSRRRAPGSGQARSPQSTWPTPRGTCLRRSAAAEAAVLRNRWPWGRGRGWGWVRVASVKAGRGLHSPSGRPPRKCLSDHTAPGHGRDLANRQALPACPHARSSKSKRARLESREQRCWENRW